MATQFETSFTGYGPNLDKVLAQPVIHIDPDVSESGDGTLEAPYKSWTDAAAKLTSGARNFVQKAGTTDVLPGDFTFSPPYDRYYFGSYGAGEKPLITKENLTNSSPNATIFSLNSRQNVSFENIRFSLVNCAGIYLSSSWQTARGLRVTNCDFTLRSTGLLLKPNGGIAEVSGINFYASGSHTHADCVIDGCTFTSDDPVTHYTVNGWKTVGIYGIFYQTITDLTVSNCRFYKLTGDGLNFFVERNKIGALDIPTGMMITDNSFEKVYGSPLSNRFGMKSVAGHESAILRNTFINVGHPDTPNINCIQGQNLHDVEIAYNYIDGVTTSAPDGAGIILDFAVGSLEHMSKGCKVHHNKIRRCRSLGSHAAAGISVYVAQDSLVYANDIFDCESGVALGKRQNTGTKVFNNTVRGCGQAFYVGDYPNNIGSSLDLLANNIARDCRLVVRSSNSSVVAASRNNYFFNCCAISNDGSFRPYIKYPDHVGDDIVDKDPVAADVSAENGWILAEASPCVGAGASLAEYSEADTASFGLNGAPLSNPPTVGAWQPE